MIHNAAIILARTDSKRFPNKALFDFNGKPLIVHCILPLLEITNVTPILATSGRDIDTPLVRLAEEYGVQSFRGNLENIAERVRDCIDFFAIQTFARINGDSPFLRKDLLKYGFDLMNSNLNLDFVTNLIPRSFPYGVSIEIIRSSIFLKNYSSINTDQYCEHITSFFYDNSEKFKFRNISSEHDLSKLRLTVDEPADIELTDYLLSEIPDIRDKSVSELYDIIVKYEKQKSNSQHTKSNIHNSDNQQK